MVNSVKLYSEFRSELEHWSAFLEPDIVMMLLVHHGGITTHRASILLRHADPVEPFPASLLRHRIRIRSRSYDSVFLRHHSRFLSRSREKKKSHKKRKFSSTSSPSSHRFSFSSFRERERKLCMSKRRNTLIYVLLT